MSKNEKHEEKKKEKEVDNSQNTNNQKKNKEAGRNDIMKVERKTGPKKNHKLKNKNVMTETREKLYHL